MSLWFNQSCSGYFGQFCACIKMIDGSSIEANVPSLLQGSLLVPKQMICSHIEASIFFQNFWKFLHSPPPPRCLHRFTTLRSAFLKIRNINVQNKGGGHRPFKQCLKKQTIWSPGASLRTMQKLKNWVQSGPLWQIDSPQIFNKNYQHFEWLCKNIQIFTK